MQADDANPPLEDFEILDSGDSDVEHFRFTPAKNITRRIDQYLVDRIAHLSRASVQRLIDEGLVKVNGKAVKASYHPKAGDDIDMVAPPKPVSEIVPQHIPLEVIHEDEHFLAINKQADLIVHPARGQWTNTLVNGLAYYGRKWSLVNGPWRPGILHRLDRNTTGIMLIAKSDEAHWRLARQFENRTIQKTYLAVVHGVPELLADLIDMPIGKDRYVWQKQAVRKVQHGGRPASTMYEVLERFADAPKGKSGDGYTLLRLTPKTGRTHQIRVHLSTIGHPIVGDTMYGGKVIESGDWVFARQALHAYEITFVHPGSLEKMTLRAEMPADMLRLLEILRQV